MAKSEHLCARKDCPIHRADEDEELLDIHGYFNLTYANYLVLHRSLLQSMPEEWQHNFVVMLNELDEAFSLIDTAPSYRVTAYDQSTGKFVKDPIPHYNRGRTYIKPHINQ